MGNPLSSRTWSGTIAELLVQLRLLQYKIQAAPPIKDSGNDLIAIKGECVKFIQVKSTTGSTVRKLNYLQNKIYHILAVVKLDFNNDHGFLLDKSKIYLIPKDIVTSDSLRICDLANYELSNMVGSLWQ